MLKVIIAEWTSTDLFVTLCAYFMGTREKDKLIGFLKTNDTLLHTLYSNEIFNLLRSTIMYTRKRKGKKRKTKRGGLGPEVYMMTGMIAVLNGLMLSFPSFGSHDNPCDKDVPVAEATVVDDSVPLATAVGTDSKKS